MDKDINGKEIIRSANISQENNYQRSKCLTHLHQVNLCLDRVQTIKSREIEKKTTSNMKHEEIVDANGKVVELICMKLVRDGIIGEGADVSKDHMKLRSMKYLVVWSVASV